MCVRAGVVVAKSFVVSTASLTTRAAQDVNDVSTEEAVDCQKVKPGRAASMQYVTAPSVCILQTLLITFIPPHFGQARSQNIVRGGTAYKWRGTMQITATYHSLILPSVMLKQHSKV